MTISHSLLSATFGTVSYTGWGRSSLQFSVLRYFKTTVWLESPPSPKWIIAHSFLLNNQDLQMSAYPQSDTFLHCSLTYKEKVMSLPGWSVRKSFKLHCQFARSHVSELSQLVLWSIVYTQAQTDGNDKTRTILCTLQHLLCVNWVSFSPRIIEQRWFIQWELTTGLGFLYWFTVVPLPGCTVVAFIELSGMYRI